MDQLRNKDIELLHIHNEKKALIRDKLTTDTGGMSTLIEKKLK